jgi:hypothetical protein
MTGPGKRKGDKAELEVQGLLRELLGVPARRKLGAGRRDDVGDIDGVPNTVIQVVNAPSDTLRAVREKPVECEQQRDRADRAKPRVVLDFARGETRVPGPTFAATFVRLRGGEYRVVLTPEQWATYWREAVA